MNREPITHNLKIHPRPFAEARAGLKRYEVRRDDRDFQVGDLVRLQEWDPARGYTGEELLPQAIGCITRGYGLLDGYVVLGLGYALTDITPQLLALQAEVKRLRHDAARRGTFIVALGEVLDVAETQDILGAGYVEEDILASARRLAALVSPGAAGHLRRALDLVQEAADSWLMGSGARAKDKAAEAAVELTDLLKGRS